MVDLEDCLFLHNANTEEAGDDDGRVLTLQCNYFESLEGLRSGDIKEMKFWMYKNDALRLASLITSVAEPTSN
jgi:hypothetical protein